jgi:hypothetical protein
MRSTFGDWCKGSGKNALGPKWATVMYQFIKADELGYWSEALDAWLAGSEGQRDAWREAAPYQATYTDPGKVFFMYARAFSKFVLEYVGDYLNGQLWGMGDSADCLSWWLTGQNEYIFKGGWNIFNPQLHFEGGSIWAWTYGKVVEYHWNAGYAVRSIGVYVDEVLLGTTPTTGTASYFGYELPDGKASYKVRFSNYGSEFQMIFVK